MLKSFLTYLFEHLRWKPRCSSCLWFCQVRSYLLHQDMDFGYCTHRALYVKNRCEACPCFERKKRRKEML